MVSHRGKDDIDRITEEGRGGGEKWGGTWRKSELTSRPVWQPHNDPCKLRPTQEKNIQQQSSAELALPLNRKDHVFYNSSTLTATLQHLHR